MPRTSSRAPTLKMVEVTGPVVTAIVDDFDLHVVGAIGFRYFI